MKDDALFQGWDAVQNDSEWRFEFDLDPGPAMYVLLLQNETAIEMEWWSRF